MCCRTNIYPLNKEIAEAVLILGQFTLIPLTEPGTWWRRITEESAEVHASMFTLGNSRDCLSLSISPAISHDYDHNNKRITAGVYFEIAAKYAEKVNGTIIQQSNIGACIQNGLREKVLAVYPDEPMDYLKICAGFQREILGSTL